VDEKRSQPKNDIVEIASSCNRSTYRQMWQENYQNFPGEIRGINISKK
jgi:hypothetical protein